jgi:hypothetical protein
MLGGTLDEIAQRANMDRNTLAWWVELYKTRPLAQVFQGERDRCFMPKWANAGTVCVGRLIAGTEGEAPAPGSLANVKKFERTAYSQWKLTCADGEVQFLSSAEMDAGNACRGSGVVCGTAARTIEEKIADCGISRDADGTRATLVTRYAEGLSDGEPCDRRGPPARYPLVLPERIPRCFEVWRDDLNGKLWSDRIVNFDALTRVFSKNDVLREVTGSTQQRSSFCAESDVLSPYPFAAAAKGGMTLHSEPSVKWRLATREDYDSWPGIAQPFDTTQSVYWERDGSDVKTRGGYQSILSNITPVPEIRENSQPGSAPRPKGAMVRCVAQ